MAATGVTQAPRWLSCCGCSSAKKQVGASRIRANCRRGLDDYQHVGLVDEGTAPANRASAAAEPTPRRAVSGPSAALQAGKQQPTRPPSDCRSPARPAIIRRAESSFTVPVSDKKGSRSRAGLVVRASMARGSGECLPRHRHPRRVGSVAGGSPAADRRGRVHTRHSGIRDEWARSALAAHATATCGWAAGCGCRPRRRLSSALV
jgi:hypothetical protein